MALTRHPLYRFELWNPIEGMVADISSMLTNRSFKIRLNRPETLDLTFDQHVLEERAAKIDLTPRQFLNPGQNEIQVWRGNRPIFGTKVRMVTPSISEDSESYQLHASGYLDDLAKRYLWPVPGVERGETRYTNVDIGQIIWGMINTTQSLPNGNVGFTQGLIQPSRVMTEIWQPFATSLKDILIAITEHNDSVDFDFSYDRKLNVYYPGQGRVHTDLMLSFPGNIKSLSAPIDADQIVNVSINRGSGNGLDQQPVEVRHDVASQQEYRRMEDINDYADVTWVPTLQSFGDETTRTFAQPLVIPSVALNSDKEPYIGSFWVGDWIPFSIPKRPAFAEVDNQLLRIHEIGVTLNDLDTEDVRLTVANK